MCGLLLYQPYLTEALQMGLTYLSTRLDPDGIVNFYFGIRVKALYLPMVMLLFDFVTTARLPLSAMIGIAAAHVIYMKEAKSPIAAPQYLYG